MRVKVYFSAIVISILCSCGKQLENPQASIPSPPPESIAAVTPQPSRPQDGPSFPQEVSLVRAIYGQTGAETNVTAKVSSIFSSGQNSIPAIGQLFDIPPNPANTLTIVFAGPSGNFQLSVKEGQAITVPVTTTIIRNTRLAPEGVYFLLRYASITTGDGVIGFNPGTRFALIKNNGTTMHVTDGKNEVDIPSDLLTNSLDVAAAAYAQDATAMAMLNHSIAHQSQSTSTPAPATTPIIIRVPVQPARSNPLDKPAYDQHRSYSPYGYYDIYHHWHYDH